jgi:hypothetical protein
LAEKCEEEKQQLIDSRRVKKEENEMIKRRFIDNLESMQRFYRDQLEILRDQRRQEEIESLKKLKDDCNSAELKIREMREIFQKDILEIERKMNINGDSSYWRNYSNKVKLNIEQIFDSLL